VAARTFCQKEGQKEKESKKKEGLAEDKRPTASTAIDTWLKAVDSLKTDLDSLMGKWSKDQDDEAPETKPGEPKEKPEKPKPEEKPTKSEKPEDKKHIDKSRPSMFDLIKKIDKDKEDKPSEEPDEDEDVLPNKLKGDKLPASLI
jgi:hypothetical protein